jgi:prophage tail gpP-like protein
MPSPTEIATITANGVTFSNWTTVEIERTMAFVSSLAFHMRVTAVEVEVHGASGIFPTAQRLKIGDSAQGSLAGIQVINGLVTVRQVMYDANAHGVEIIVSSLSQRVEVSTVKAEPGQYLNQSLGAIGSAVFGAVGVGFSNKGSEKIFPRISEMIGETRFQFIERLCRMRQVHMMDDGTGNVVAIQNATGAVSTTLTEGVNILRARFVERVDDTADFMEFVGQAPPMPMGGMGDMSSKASTTVPGPSLGRPVKYACEINADNQGCTYRVNFERDMTLFEQVDLTITVKGWLMTDGSLWIQHVGETASVYSPLLFPQNQRTFRIKGIRHKQSSEEGTTTDVLLTNESGDTLNLTGATPPPLLVPGL